MLVAINTIFLSKHNLIGASFSSFGISWLWSGNVKRAAFGDLKTRFVYAFGATCGCIAGVLIFRIFA
jgi:hypothetical protein